MIGDAMPHGHCLDLVMRDVDRRGAEATLNRDDVCPGLDAERGIEIGEGFVHQEHLRIANDGPRQRNPLALASGKLSWFAIQECLQPERFSGFPAAQLSFFAWHPLLTKGELDVPPHRHVGVERIALEDHGDVTILRSDVVDYGIPDRDGSVGHVLETGDHAQSCGLPAS